MSWLDGIAQKLGYQPTSRVAEVIDPDEAMYRLASFNSEERPNDPTSDYERTKQRRLARVNYFRNAIGGAIPDIVVSKVVGTGVTFKAKDENVQEVVDRFLQDPDNDLDQFLDLYVTELNVFGELILPVFVTPENGDCRLGYLLPDQVEDIIWQQGNAKKAIAVLQRSPGPTEAKRLWIVPSPSPEFEGRYPPHPAITNEQGDHVVPGEDGLPVALPLRGGVVESQVRALLADDKVKVAGYAFYHRHRSLVSGRGRGIYERINDWIKGVDDFMFGTLRNAILQGLVLLRITIRGASDTDLKKRRAEMKVPPRSGSVVITNETEEWEYVAPNVTSPGAIRELFTGGLKVIGISAGLPGHEVGAEDDTNRATAGESRNVSTYMAKRLQRVVSAMTQAWLGYMIDQKKAAGQLNGATDLDVEPVLPDLDPRDEQAGATTFSTTVTGAIQAVDNELLLRRDARVAVYRALGLEPPTDKEFEAALAADREALEEDLVGSAGTRLAGLIGQINAVGQRQGANGNVPPPSEEGNE
jgi:hypothetical protein